MTNKSILVLEENSVIHGLVASALDVDGVTLHHEFNPAKYVDRARNLNPDLILVSNADQFNNYSICRQLKTGVGTGTPLVLLANSKDKLDESRLRDLRVDGVVRKPFEASDLQEQVSRHLRLPDLVGMGYEFRQSQTARESAYDPLAQMEVLDEETVTMMKASGAPGSMPVPEVDFSDELSHEAGGGESFTQATMTRRTETTRTETRSTQYEQTIEHTSASTQSPLPLQEFDDSDLETFDSAEGETMLQAETFEQESLGEPFPATRAADDGEFAELGAEDLLDEETLEEAVQFSMDEEITETRITAPAKLEPSPLDKIDVELSASDLLVQQAASLEPEPDDMTLFEQEMESAPPKKELDETIPLAVRRMMELKPVFTPPARHMTETVRTETTITKTESVQREAGVPEMPWPKLADKAEPTLPPPAQAPLDDFQDMDLGDDALDEEEILSAMESEPLAEVDDMDALDDDSLMALSLEEEDQLTSIPEPTDAEIELSAPEEDDEELTIDEDEEELILSSLEEEELQGLALESGPAASLDLTSTERTGLDEIISSQSDEVVTRTVTETVVTESADAFQDIDLEMEAEEATPRESVAAFPQDELLEVPPDDFDMNAFDSTVATTTTTTTTTVTTESVQTMDAAASAAVDPLDQPLDQPDVTIEFGSDDLEADLFSENDLASIGDDLEPAKDDLDAQPFPELTDEQLPVIDEETVEEFRAETIIESTPAPAVKPTVVPAPKPAPAPKAVEADGDDDGFESAFASLRSEIESNPEGEHLDDVLRLEGIQNKVSRLDFTIPQHESPFARGIGIYAAAEGGEGIDPMAPAEAAVSVTSMEATHVESASREASTTVTTERTVHTTTIETKLSQALDGSALTGSLLDEATKARLSQVLDEIISISVRKAVREEMPRLMQRLAKDSQ